MLRSGGAVLFFCAANALRPFLSPTQGFSFSFSINQGVALGWLVPGRWPDENESALTGNILG
jgi:hypothetical protein